MDHGKVNAKNMWKFIANACNKDKMLLMSCDYKCAVKTGTSGNALALVPKCKSGWIATSFEAKNVDHDAFVKSNVVPSATLMTDVPNDCNLGKFCKGEVHVVLKE